MATLWRLGALRILGLLALTTTAWLGAPRPAGAYTGQDPYVIEQLYCNFTQLNVSLNRAGVRHYDLVGICSGYSGSFVAKGAWEPGTGRTSEVVTNGSWRLQSSTTCQADPWITGAPCAEGMKSATSDISMIHLPAPVSARAGNFPRQQLQARLSQAVPPPPPNPPLAPLDVKATLPLVSGGPAHVQWSAADQSGNRPAMSFVVERQSPPGENRPWIQVGSNPGPAGSQTATTRLHFELSTPRVQGTQHAFRVCALNEGGRACSAPVPVTISSNVLQQRPGVGVRPPPQ